MSKLFRALLLAALLILPAAPVFAQAAPAQTQVPVVAQVTGPSATAPAPIGQPGPAAALGKIAGSQQLSLSLQILILMSLLTVLPSLILMMTSFTRIIIVLSILRQALGLQQTPPNQVLVGLAMFLSLFVMQPVLTQVNETALKPYNANQITLDEGISRAGVQFHKFMAAQTRKADVTMFTKLAKAQQVAKSEDIPFSILLPAFVTSELKTSFQIGFLIFLPFLIIDLIVASSLMSLGMMMLSPTIISLPFKLLLFVLVDGWALTMGSLASSFVR